jgi:hypothetical protein
MKVQLVRWIAYIVQAGKTVTVTIFDVVLNKGPGIQRPEDAEIIKINQVYFWQCLLL